MCGAAEGPMTVDFTPEAWAAHTRWDQSCSVVRCRRCAELLPHGAVGPGDCRAFRMQALGAHGGVLGQFSAVCDRELS